LNENHPHFEPWLNRYEAIGRAQHRYLYLLLVLAVFFLVLDGGPGSVQPAPDQPFRLEFLNLEVPRLAVWVLGPPIISFVLMAFLGTFPAACSALRGLRSAAPDGLSGEAYDRVPNLIDFAVYTQGEVAVFIRVIALSSYPLFATFVLCVAIHLVIRIASHPAIGFCGWAVIVVTLVLWVPVTVRLSCLWKSKMKSALRMK